MTLLKDLMTPANFEFTTLTLYPAWACWAATCGMMLANMHLSYTTTRSYRIILDEEYRKYTKGALPFDELWEQTAKRQTELKRNRWINRLNCCSVVGFIA